ncbi:hypothetical protein AgCh_013253 [Apium graveolens]
MVEEGQLYDLQNFRVIEAVGRLRPVSSTMSIAFIQSTIMNPVGLYIPPISMNKFEFVSFGEQIKPKKISIYGEIPTYSLATQQTSSGLNTTTSEEPDTKGAGTLP